MLPSGQAEARCQQASSAGDSPDQGLRRLLVHASFIEGSNGANGHLKRQTCLKYYVALFLFVLVISHPLEQVSKMFKVHGE